jgi:prepilin-type N-terminal cleavage/methylation domain-containing protein
MNKQKSFTLVEIMVAVIIVGILVTIALPGFIKNAEESRQTEAIDILTRMYKGYRALITEEVINNDGNFINGTAADMFNPDESNTVPNNPSGRSDMSWKALGFPQNVNYEHTNLYFSYDFLKGGESSESRSNCTGSPPTAEAPCPWGIAYRKRSNAWVGGTHLYPVNFNKRIYIIMSNGAIVKSSEYQ